MFGNLADHLYFTKKKFAAEKMNTLGLVKHDLK